MTTAHLQPSSAACPKSSCTCTWKARSGPRRCSYWRGRNGVALPADFRRGAARLVSLPRLRPFHRRLRRRFAACIRTPADLELIAGEFLRGQAEQNIRYSEVDLHALHPLARRIPFARAAGRPRPRPSLGRRSAGRRRCAWCPISRAMCARSSTVCTSPDWAIEGKGMGSWRWAWAGRRSAIRPSCSAAPSTGPAPPAWPPAPRRRDRRAGQHLGRAARAAAPSASATACAAWRTRRWCSTCASAPDPARRQPQQQRLPRRGSIAGRAPAAALLAEAGLFVTLNSDDPSIFNTTLTGRVPAHRRGLRLRCRPASSGSS